MMNMFSGQNPEPASSLPAQPLALDVAHELSNIMGCLTILPEIMQRQLPRNSALHQDLREVQRAVRRLDDLATQLSLLTADRLVHEPVDLSSLVREVLQKEPIAGIISQVPDLEMDFRIDPGLPPVRASGRGPQIIFRNLVRAAVEAMPEGGRLMVSLTHRTLGSDLPGLDRVPVGDYVVMSVGHTGPALSPEQCAMVFEPYLSPNLYPSTAVVRLGLMVVRRLLRRKKGVLSIRSGQRGTFFDAYFPVWRAAATPPSQPAGTAKPRVMVVEDRQEQRDLFARILEKAGYAVATASGDSEALAVREDPADLVLLDISLRRQRDGLDLYRRLKAMWPRQRFLFMSGHDREEYAATLPEILEAHFLHKPFSAERLLTTIEASLAAPQEN